MSELSESSERFRSDIWMICYGFWRLGLDGLQSY